VVALRGWQAREKKPHAWKRADVVVYGLKKVPRGFHDDRLL